MDQWSLCSAEETKLFHYTKALTVAANYEKARSRRAEVVSNYKIENGHYFIHLLMLVRIDALFLTRKSDLN